MNDSRSQGFLCVTFKMMTLTADSRLEVAGTTRSPGYCESLTTMVKMACSIITMTLYTLAHAHVCPVHLDEVDSWVTPGDSRVTSAWVTLLLL